MLPGSPGGSGSDTSLVQGRNTAAVASASRIGLEPDLSYWAGERCLFVGDVKYKRIMPAGYPNADLYQLTAYTIATQLDSGMLVYASGETLDTVHEVRHLGKRLVIAPLDLGVPPERILQQVTTLAARIAEIAPAARHSATGWRAS